MPRTPNPDLARHLLEAALALLDEGGANGFGLREVAARVDYSVTAVYRCYGSKAGLLDALRGRLTTGLALHLGIAGGAPARDQLIGFARRFIRWAIAHPHRHELLFATRPTPGVSTPVRALVGILRATLRRGVQAGELEVAQGAGELDEPATAATLFALLNGVASLAVYGQLSDLGLPDPEAFARDGAATWVDRVVHFVRDSHEPIG